jgi:hypothetical protein
MRTTFGYTGITVGDKRPLEQFVSIIIVEVMHHTVTELCGKDLPLLGSLDDETGRRGWLIRPVP